MILAALAAGACLWCVDGNPPAEKELMRLAALPPRKLLAEVRKAGACVKILDSGRRVPGGAFHWGQVEAPTGTLSAVTRQAGLMGKTLCKGELPLSRDCTTIALASDAPLVTILHEYLHTRQIAGDESWCQLSAALWSHPPTPVESRALRDREWDVVKLLWRAHARMKLSLEDRVALTSDVITEAGARADYDATALDFANREHLRERLNTLIGEYTKKMGAR
jgi:hypothetical protein